MSLGKLYWDVSSEIFYIFPNTDKLVSLNFHHSLLIMFSKIVSKDHQNNNVHMFWTNCYICLLLQYMENHSSNGLFVVQSKTFVTLLEILDVSFFLLTSNGDVLDCAKSLRQRCCLFLMLWKNANHSLLDSIFCSKPSKCTQDSDCPFSFLEQFLIQIPRYTLFTYSIDNDFKLLPGRVNFVIVL